MEFPVSSQTHINLIIECPMLEQIKQLSVKHDGTLLAISEPERQQIVLDQ